MLGFNDFNYFNDFNEIVRLLFLMISVPVLQELWPPSRLLAGGWRYRTPLGGGLDGFLKETQGKPTGRRSVHSPGPASAVYYLMILMKFNDFNEKQYNLIL